MGGGPGGGPGLLFRVTPLPCCYAAFTSCSRFGACNGAAVIILGACPLKGVCFLLHEALLQMLEVR